MKVPQLDLVAQYGTLRGALRRAVDDLFESQRFILGPAVEDFEDAMAGLLGVPGAVGLSSGSEALRVALAVLDVGPGDEVLLPAFTFFATASAVVHRGARPVFVDVGEDFLMDPADAAVQVTSRTRAAICVHLYGLQVPWAPWRELAAAHGLRLIEDAAQCVGARRAGEGHAGSLGDAAAFSFFPSKNLGGAGDGGLLTARDPALLARARRYRNHGEACRYHHEEVGINGRLDALQAVVLHAKLPHLAAWNEARRARAGRYEALFAASRVAERVGRPVLPAGGEHVFHQYTIRVPERRDALLDWLREREIGAAVYYPLPLHRQPCFAAEPSAARPLPVTERLAGEVLSLPIYPEISEDQQAWVVASIEAFYGR
ncbi:MAG: DegT/DnrJ/EryC1/StrS family aminotransferase [Candidatus Krumholzibacteriota bacterium]|nr:DegT/DnrJ/EryC1/StrS family aminotransferase [Candidatus Krumholzibacteriota bacterium]